MGKIISKVRQREFNAMLYRRAFERDSCINRSADDTGTWIDPPKKGPWRWRYEFSAFILVLWVSWFVYIAKFQ